MNSAGSVQRASVGKVASPRKSCARKSADSNKWKLIYFAIRDLIDTNNKSAILIRSDGIVMHVNETGAEKLGRKPADIIGESIFDFLATTVLESRKTQMNRALSVMVPVFFEDTQGECTFSHSMYPVCIQSSTPDMLVVISQSISVQDDNPLFLKQPETVNSSRRKT